MFNEPTGRGFPQQQELASAQGVSIPANSTPDIWDGGGNSRHLAASTKYSNVSLTIAAPCVVTYPAAGEAIEGNPIVFATTGALPTNVTAGTTYYILNPTGATSNIAATVGGTAIDTTGSQSGVQTAKYNVPITSFGTAPYVGAEVHCIMEGAHVLTHSTNLNLPTSANITTAAGDHFDVYADTKKQLDIRNYTRANGVPLVLITAPMSQKRTYVALGAGPVTATAAQMVTSGVISVAPGGAEALTTDTATAIIALLTGYSVGTTFEFNVINIGAFTSTLTAGTGVTIVGVASIGANTSVTFKGIVNSSTTLTIYRTGG